VLFSFAKHSCFSCCAANATALLALDLSGLKERNKILAQIIADFMM
jgi:hypothetical protein